MASACAYGGPPNNHVFQTDSGVLHADGGAKDASKPKPDAQVVEDASVDPPDVTQQTTCSSLPLGTGMAQCDSCLGASCCAEDQMCGNDQDCIAFISCVNPCFNQTDGGFDQTCEQACESQYPNGASELANLDMCMQNSCATPCGI